MTWSAYNDDQNHFHRRLVFENDPGRRNHSLVGSRHLRDILSLNVVSRNLLLLQIGKGTGNSDSYWSFVTLDGRLNEMNNDLFEQLNLSEPGRFWTRIQSCIVKGNICRILLVSINQEHEPIAKLLELADTGELLHNYELGWDLEINPATKKPKHQCYMMNRAGDLLKWSAKLLSRNEERKIRLKPSIELDGRQIKQIEFDNKHENTALVFTGEFLCWLTSDYQVVKLVYLNDKDIQSEGK